MKPSRKTPVNTAGKARKYAATLLFQWRVVVAGDSGARRLCERRIINLYQRSAQTAARAATRHGRAAEFTYQNSDGNRVFFEFVGITDLMELGVECEPEEVWYDIVEMVRPMERRNVLIPPIKQLNAFKEGTPRLIHVAGRDQAKPVPSKRRTRERKR